MENQSYTLVATYNWKCNDLTEWVDIMCIQEELIKSFTESHTNYIYDILNTVSEKVYETTIFVFENIC